MWYEDKKNFPALIEANGNLVIVNSFDGRFVYDTMENSYDIIDGNWKLASSNQLNSIFSKSIDNTPKNQLTSIQDKIQLRMSKKEHTNAFDIWTIYHKMLAQELTQLKETK